MNTAFRAETEWTKAFQSLDDLQATNYLCYSYQFEERHREIVRLGREFLPVVRYVKPKSTCPKFKEAIKIKFPASEHWERRTIHPKYTSALETDNLDRETAPDILVQLE